MATKQRFPHPPHSPEHSPTPEDAGTETTEMATAEVVVDLETTRVEFMEMPPARLLCVSCKKVLRNPHITSCCSSRYCRKCIHEALEQKGNACPSCGEQKCEVTFDESAQRSVNELFIRCVHVQDGCMWFGRMEYLPLHLDEGKAKQLPGSQRRISVTSCTFVMFPCPHDCGKEFNRTALFDHQTKRCPKRPYTCEHCSKYRSTYSDAELYHFPSCNMFPVTCPNKCPQKTVPRWKLQQHIMSECLYQDNIECMLSFAGCSAKMRRKDVATHIQNNLVEHFSLLASAFLRHKSEVQELISEGVASQPTPQPLINGSTREEDYDQVVGAKDVEIQRLKAELQQAKKEKEEELGVMKEMVNTLKKSLEEQERRLRVAETVNAAMVKEVSHLRPFISGPLPINFTVPKFDQLRKEDKWWYSRPFYSSVCGYRLGMFVFCNGVLDGKGSHVSIFIYLVRGEYDDDLVWPFRGNITILLLNQRADRNHYQKVIRFTPDSPAAVCNRVSNGEMAKEGNGPTQFISHKDLEFNASTDTQYLRDDCLKIRVKSVHLRNIARGRAISIDGIGPQAPVRPNSPGSTTSSPPHSPLSTPASATSSKSAEIFSNGSRHAEEERVRSSPETNKKVRLQSIDESPSETEAQSKPDQETESHSQPTREPSPDSQPKKPAAETHTPSDPSPPPSSSSDKQRTDSPHSSSSSLSHSSAQNTEEASKNSPRMPIKQSSVTTEL